MTVKELIEELEKENPNAEVSITVGYGCNSCVSAFDLTFDSSSDGYVDIYGEEACDSYCGTVNITETKHDRTTPMDVLREKLMQKKTTT